MLCLGVLEQYQGGDLEMSLQSAQSLTFLSTEAMELHKLYLAEKVFSSHQY